MAPEMSADAIYYHLAEVAHYNRAHGFSGTRPGFYSTLPQGLEMLFLFAFSVGRHSAAALVHLALLYALTFAMLCYGRRQGMPLAGLSGSLLMFAAPVFGVTSVIAYVDTGLACVVFAAFYLLRIWADTSDRRVLALAGFTAGFAFAVKYTGGLALLLGARHDRVPAERAAPQGPGMLRGVLIVCCDSYDSVAGEERGHRGNPVAPFFNTVFPNPYITVELENEWRQGQSHMNGLTLREMPLELTIKGYRAQGLFGWVFLLAPVALLTLKKTEGRYLLFASVLLAVAILGNKGARFLCRPSPSWPWPWGSRFRGCPRSPPRSWSHTR
jgi:hypothetical protein